MPRKRRNSDSDEDYKPVKQKDEVDTDTEENDADGDGTAAGKITKLEFIPFINDLHKYGVDKIRNLRGKPNIAKIASTIPELDRYKPLYSQRHVYFNCICLAYNCLIVIF